MENKKIAILTQPLQSNYGGLLQAYALSKVLSEFGADVTVVNRVRDTVGSNLYQKLLLFLKSIIKKYVLRRVELDNLKLYTDRFVSKYINKSEDIVSTLQLKKFCVGNFDSYVVGSDQCWRPKYSPCITNYFLDFLEDNSEVKKVSYAASFGVDEIEYSESELENCKKLISKFDAISVREDSAVMICKEKFNVDNVVHVLDPTMLLAREDYLKLLEDEKSPGNLFAYILDDNNEKINVITKVEKKLGLKSFRVEANYQKNNFFMKKEHHAVPPVENWLAGFRDAKFVVTDSFHGCVFSIIFNKPFIAIGNKSRGMARFNSLLSLFGLQDRLLLSGEGLPEDILPCNIDWEKVNCSLAEERGKSLFFLKKWAIGN